MAEQLLTAEEVGALPAAARLADGQGAGKDKLAGGASVFHIG